jgi:hypothetical protein
MARTCEKCGSQLNKNASFCGSCGTPSDKKCPRCGNEQSPNSVFCGKCGDNLSTPRTATENNPQLNQSTSRKKLGPSNRKTLLGLLFITGTICITLAIASVAIHLQAYFDFEKDTFDDHIGLVLILWWLSVAVTIGFAILFFFIRTRNMKALKASILAILLPLVLVGSCAGNLVLLATKSDMDSNARIEKYSEDIRLNPNDHNAYRLRAESQWWTDEGTLLAIDDYTQAINLAGNLEDDLSDLDYLINLHIARADRYQNLIKWHDEDSIPSSDNDKEMYQLVIDDLTTAIRIITSDNDNSYLYIRRGDLHARMGEYELAIEDYNQVSNSSDYMYVHDKKARIYMKLGKDDLAFEVWDEYVKTHPEEPWAYCERGFLYDEMDMPEQKHMDFDKAEDLGERC